MISTDHSVTHWMMEEELEISRETIYKSLIEVLGKWKICTRFIPHCLTIEQKAASLARVCPICGW
jgi:hypothetical protein